MCDNATETSAGTGAAAALKVPTGPTSQEKSSQQQPQRQQPRAQQAQSQLPPSPTPTSQQQQLQVQPQRRALQPKAQQQPQPKAQQQPQPKAQQQPQKAAAAAEQQQGRRQTIPLPAVKEQEMQRPAAQAQAGAQGGTTVSQQPAGGAETQRMELRSQLLRNGGNVSQLLQHTRQTLQAALRPSSAWPLPFSPATPRASHKRLAVRRASSCIPESIPENCDGRCSI